MVEKLSASESRYTEAVRQWGEDKERLAAWEPVVRAAIRTDAWSHIDIREAVAALPEPLRPAGEKA